MMTKLTRLVIFCLFVGVFVGQSLFLHPANGQSEVQYRYAYAYQVPPREHIVIKTVDPANPAKGVHLYSATLSNNAALYGALASPDGQWIVLIPDARGTSVQLVEVATGQTRNVAAQLGFSHSISNEGLLGQYQRITWAPNSQSLAFVSQTEEKIDVFVYNLADDTRINLSNDPSSQFAVVWSPDSTYLASGGIICNGSDCNVQVDVFDWSTRSRIVSQTVVPASRISIATAICQLHWSPDSRFLSFVSSCDAAMQGIEKELFLLDLFQGTMVSLTNHTETAIQAPGAPGDYPLRWGIYDTGWYDVDSFFLGETFAQGDLDHLISQTVRYEVITGSQAILRPDVMAEEWTLNPVQNQFAYRTVSGYPNGRIYSGVEIANIAGGTLTAVGTGPAGCNLTWTPDGTTLAYTGHGQPMESCYDPIDALYFMDATTGQLTQHTIAEVGEVRAAGWVSLTPNIPPTANAGPDQDVIDDDNNGTENTLLDPTGSYDSDGFIEHYEWYENGRVIAGGFTPQEPNTVHFSVGEHTITLIVTDNYGATGSDNVLVTVESPTACTSTIAVGDVTGLISTINTANANLDADTICLAADSTYTLTDADNTSYGSNGLPVITTDITIQGNNATLTRDPAADPFRFFQVDTSGSLTLYDLILSGGATLSQTPGQSRSKTSIF